MCRAPVVWFTDPAQQPPAKKQKSFASKPTGSWTPNPAEQPQVKKQKSFASKPSGPPAWALPESI